MATIKFYLQSKKNPAGIYVRLREGKDIDAKAKTKFAINPFDWSSSKEQPKNLKDEGFKKMASDLLKFKSKLLAHFNNSIEYSTIDSSWLKAFISPIQDDFGVPNKLVDYFTYYEIHKKSVLMPSSLSKLVVVKKLIQRFQKSVSREYLIKDINANFKLDFEEYCIGDGYSINTIARAIKSIKTICNHAKENGVETHFQLTSIKLKSEKVSKVFLNCKELEEISNWIFTNKYLENARDWLIISCETGQRVSDFMKFRKSGIRIKEIKKDGNMVEVQTIEFTQQKTNKVIGLPLSEIALNVLKKREGEFPTQISSQRYNEYIKKVCKEVGLTQDLYGGKMDIKTNRKILGMYPKHELITSHIGRRSFADNYYGKIPTPILMSVTGHTTEKAFLEYVGRAPAERIIEIAQFF
jgi:site-specific recombinase XerD